MHEYYWPELAKEHEFTVLTHEYYWPEYHKLPWSMNITLKYAIKIITVATQSEDRQRSNANKRLLKCYTHNLLHISILILST